MKYFFLFILLSLIAICVIILGIFYIIKDDLDFCLDSGICAEGIEINTKYGLVKINKENCLKYGYQWNDYRKDCNLNKTK